MKCPGSVHLERLFPNESSSYAEEGTLAHAWAAFMLDPKYQERPKEELPDEHRSYVNDYAMFVNRETEDGFRQIEFRVEISDITGEPGAVGTVDCAALVGNTLKIIDFKFGQGVLVEAQNNPQLLIYALASRRFFSLFDDIETIEMTIFQPRKDHIDTWTITAEEAEELAKQIREKADKAMGTLKADPLPQEVLNPSEDGCRFCRAKAVCPAKRALAERAAKDAVAQPSDFEEIKDEKPVPMLDAEIMSPKAMAENLKLADLLEPWITAVREEAHRRLMEGVELPGYKLVLGRPGNRQWSDSKEAETMLKAFKLKEDERYTFKLISPTQAEKLFKAGRIGERQWKKAEALITRSEPQPTLAPETDKRPAWHRVAQPSDFSSVNN